MRTAIIRVLGQNPLEKIDRLLPLLMRQGLIMEQGNPFHLPGIEFPGQKRMDQSLKEGPLPAFP